MYTRAFAFFVGYTRRDSKGEQYAYHSSRDRECALSRHVLQYRIHLKHVVAEYMGDARTLSGHHHHDDRQPIDARILHECS